MSLLNVLRKIRYFHAICTELGLINTGTPKKEDFSNTCKSQYT